MERRRVKLRTVLSALLIAALSACSSAPKSTSVDSLPKKEQVPSPSENPSVTSDSEVFGPFPGPGAQTVPSPNGVAPLNSNPDKIVLVLGPGLTHGYSYVGVIKALTELKIPIQAIYGTEMGALVGALYFSQPNPNRIDWALLRFNEKNLTKPKGKFALLKLKSPEGELDQKLKEVFGESRVENFSDRLHIIVEDAKTGERLEAKSGDLWRAVRGALAGSNEFSPVDFEGRSIKASTRKVSEEYRIARQVEGNPIVVAIAGQPPTDLFRKLIEEQKSTLLYIPLPGIDDQDLKKRNQAVFSGKSAVHQAANEILGLVGRKTE